VSEYSTYPTCTNTVRYTQIVQIQDQFLKMNSNIHTAVHISATVPTNTVLEYIIVPAVNELKSYTCTSNVLRIVLAVLLASIV
jgi:hypothetical protein